MVETTRCFLVSILFYSFGSQVLVGDITRQLKTSVSSLHCSKIRPCELKR